MPGHGGGSRRDAKGDEEDGAVEEPVGPSEPVLCDGLFRLVNKVDGAREVWLGNVFGGTEGDSVDRAAERLFARIEG